MAEPNLGMGGAITFRLGESGESTLSFGRSSGHKVDIHGVEDITMGIGEDVHVSYKTQEVYFIFFVPVDAKSVFSSVEGVPGTLYGTYYGNSHSNRFLAVQQLEPVMLQRS